MWAKSSAVFVDNSSRKKRRKIYAQTMKSVAREIIPFTVL